MRRLRDRPKKGNLILAVSGGMYAEGIDYQGDMLAGTGAYEAVAPTFPFTSSRHLAVRDGCVHCHTHPHEGEVAFTGHTFLPTVESCEECHGVITGFDQILAKEDFDGDSSIEGVQHEVEGLMVLLHDAIVEATETGSTLRANRLRILDTVMESNTQLIANDAALADPWKRTKIENIALLLRAAIEAQGRVGLMLNVPRAALDRVLALLPALQRPTISSLSDNEWVAVNTIIEERTVRDLIPKLKAAGGQGIVEYPLNKIVV